jgi:hypothetical protein
MLGAHLEYKIDTVRIGNPIEVAVQTVGRSNDVPARTQQRAGAAVGQNGGIGRRAEVHRHDTVKTLPGIDRRRNLKRTHDQQPPIFEALEIQKKGAAQQPSVSARMALTA